MLRRSNGIVWRLLSTSRTRSLTKWSRHFSAGSKGSDKQLTKDDTVRVRYAPSPTGYLHLGGLRTALFNYLFAKNQGGQFILRIEDTDKTRQVEGSIEALVKSLKWCGLEEDEGPYKGGPYGPYIQSQRLPIYKEHAEKLIERGHAYRCFCSSERLQKLRESQTRQGEATMYDRACLGLSPQDIQDKMSRGEPHTIRLKIPEGKTTVKDLLRGYVQFDHAGIDDQVLMKSDGYPTYHLANVVDDHAMKITHVIRGEEWLPSTPKHVILYKAFGFEPPKWAHLGLLLNEDRSKLSKRQGDVAVEDFRDKGYLPSGLVNFVALLGWNPAGGNNQEIFDMKQLENHFSLDKVNKSGSIVNPERLRWINSRHVRSLFDKTTSRHHQEKVISQVLPFITSSLSNPQEKETFLKSYGIDYIWKAMDLMKERVCALPEFGPLCIPFFETPDYTTKEALEMKQKYLKDPKLIHEIIEQVIDKLKELNDQKDFNAPTITKEIKSIANKNKLGLKSVLMPVRYYLTAMEVGAGLGETIELLGKKIVLQRLQSCSLN